MAQRLISRTFVQLFNLPRRFKSHRVFLGTFNDLEEFSYNFDVKTHQSATRWENNVPKQSIKNLDNSKIDILFNEIVNNLEDNEALFELMKQCIEANRLPSLCYVITVLTKCAENGDKTTISDIIKQLKTTDFDYFLAEAIWVKGNVDDSIKLFKTVYKRNPYLRRTVRLTLKRLIKTNLINKSEAALILVTQYAKELANDYNDRFVLVCLWETCLISEWHHDQMYAIELLIDDPKLIQAVTSRISYVVNLLLNKNRVEVVYKLLEALLFHEVKSSYPIVLTSLMDYQLNNGDLRSCVEIVRWSIDNDVSLPSVQQSEFINLLARKCDNDLVEKNVIKKKCNNKKDGLQFKF